MKKQSNAIALALLAVLFWSTAASAFKISLRYTDPSFLMLISVLVAVIVLLALNLRSGTIKETFSLSFRAYLHSALMGFLNPFLYYAVLFVAYDRLLAQEAVVLNYLWPVILVLLSIIILKQKIAYYQLAGILISFAGTIIIATQGKLAGFHFTDPIGVALAAGSAFVWALYWILNMKDKRNSLPKLLLNFIFGLLFILIYFIVGSGEVPTSLQAYYGGIYIGFFEMGLTFFIWLTALKLSSDTAKVSNLIFISPFLSLIWVHFSVGETILSSTFAGLIFILAGVGLQRIRRKAAE